MESTAVIGYTPSPRIEHLRDRALSQPGELFFGWHRAYLYMEGWEGAESQPLPIRNAHALAHVIENMPVRMIEGEILVGEHGNPLVNMHLMNLVYYVPEESYSDIASSDLTCEQKDRLFSWLKTEPFKWQSILTVAPPPPEYVRAHECGVIMAWGTDLNHSIRGYEKCLRLGFSGIKAEIDAALANLSPADPEMAVRRTNLLAFRRVCEAAMSLGKRHAEHARKLASEAVDDVLRREWLEVADVCDRVPAQSARTFKEALQALWFAHMITVWEDGVNANGIGRLDQFLLPYYERDIAQGVITREEAREMLAALWVKLYQPYDVQQMMIGGQLADGTDAVNDLSYMVLDVTEGLGFVRCLSARLHHGSPKEFVSRCVDLVAKGGGIPFFFNDEALIPALVDKGIPIEDARGYAAIGCVEITIPGKASPHAVSNWINVAKCLELALNDGRDLRTGEQLGPKTRCLADFRSMDDVTEAYTKQFEYFTEWAVYGSNYAEIAHRSQYRLPYLSILTEDCIESGLDIIEGGAKYNYHSSAAVGIPNVADSFAALESAVFTGGMFTPSEMLEMLREDFAGRDDLRLYLRNRVPKYGNDEPLPDDYAARVARQYCETLGRHRTPTGDTFFCHLFSFTTMLFFGSLTGASPDGRLAGEPLAYSLSPSQGRDREGLTAVLNSLAKIPHRLAAASTSAIIEVDPNLLEGAGKQMFVHLLVTAIEQGIGQLQFNVVSEETLRAAQEDPERYSNLCVRVSGFSQQFCLLDRQMQDHIIARTKHKR